MIDRQKPRENPESNTEAILARLPEHQQVSPDELGSYLTRTETSFTPNGTSHQEIQLITGAAIKTFYEGIDKGEYSYADGQVLYRDVIQGKVRAALIEGEDYDAVCIINLETGAAAVVEDGVEKSIQELGFYGAQPTTSPGALAEAFGLGESSIPADDPVRQATGGECDLAFTTSEQFKRYTRVELTPLVRNQEHRLYLQPQDWQEAQKMMHAALGSVHREALSLTHLADRPFTMSPELDTPTFIFDLTELSLENQAAVADAVDTLPMQLDRQGQERQQYIATMYQVLVRRGMFASDLDQAPLLNVAEKIDLGDSQQDKPARAWGVLLAMEYNANEADRDKYQSPAKIYTHIPSLVNEVLELFHRKQLPVSTGWERAIFIQQMLEEYQGLHPNTPGQT